MRIARTLFDLIRGAMIGVAEVIPGISGGTIALIIGVYETLIDSAGHLVRGLVRAAVDVPARRGLTRAREHLQQVRWSVVLPVAAGMVLAVLTAARVVAPLVEEHPVGARAVFAGLIVVSLIVPARMVGGRWTAREWMLAVPAAAVSFLLTGIPPRGDVDPSLLMVAGAAAIAVCALVLPGVSGSFFLVAIGMYEPTLRALNERDLAYVGVFVLGAFIGLGLFVQALLWLLEHRRRVTLAIMTGLMAGSLRALWPWQGPERELLAPTGDVLSVVGLFLLGGAVVASLLVTESVLVRRRMLSGENPLHPDGAEPGERP